MRLQQQQQPMQTGLPIQGAPQRLTQQLVTAATAQAARELQLNCQLAKQTLKNLVRYRGQFHAQCIDLEHKIRSQIPPSWAIALHATPVLNLASMSPPLMQMEIHTLSLTATAVPNLTVEPLQGHGHGPQPSDINHASRSYA